MPKVIFNNKDRLFFNDVKLAVDHYFTENNIRKTGNIHLYLKTLLLVPSAIALYILLLTVSIPVWLALPMCGMLGFILASIGFNIMHDACHGSYSRKKWVNELFGYSLNALGGNAFIWKFKHNIIHHTYPNIDGVDDDIAKSPLIRQCGTQKWVPAHRFQHIYVVLVYAISSFAWTAFMDFNKYFRRKVYTTDLQKLNVKEHIIFWMSKLMYIVFYILIPILMAGAGKWALGFIVMHIVFGFTLAIVSQLAHVVEETEFEQAGIEPRLIENEWAVHQVKTTANFSPRNKLISWFVGGLNYQIEHHLFPKISHVHYPAISSIVQQKCKEHNLEYRLNDSLGKAIASHFRMMKELGKRPPELAGLVA
jgi:linoleoyl-CoA desaturase